MQAHLLVAAGLLQAACSSSPVAVTNGSLYVCPDGLRIWAGLNEDRSVMRMTLKARTYSLARSEAGDSYSNARFTARRDDLFLHLNIAGTLLPQHCRLAIGENTQTPGPATPP